MEEVKAKVSIEHLGRRGRMITSVFEDALVITEDELSLHPMRVIDFDRVTRYIAISHEETEAVKNFLRILRGQ